MLRASAMTENGPLLVCGLSDGNIARLKAGQPIVADLNSFGQQLPGKLTIIHGTAEADIERMLRENGLLSDRTRTSVDARVDQEAKARAEYRHILIATVGLPRSGKSTWAKQQAYPIVNPDSIRLALHGQRFYGPAEPMVWATAKLMVRSLFLAGHRHVILDATNVERSRRDEWKSKEWGIFFKYIPTPKDVCIERARSENYEELVGVIERMAGQFNPLGSDEELWP